MDYRYLQAFLSAARRLSFTRAAEDLGITQAAVSRQVRLLEESVGAQLMIRSPQQVRLTPVGERLFRESSQLDTWIKENLKSAIPTIRIASVQGMLETWLVEVVARYFEKNEVNFSLKTGTREEIRNEIESGRVDVALNIQKVENEQFTSFRLLREQIVIVSKRKIDLEKLETYPWVSFDPNSYFVPFCGKMSTRIIQVESIRAVLALVSQDVGITMMPSHLIPNPKEFKIYPAGGFKNEVVWVTTLNYSEPPEALQKFIQRLRMEAGKVS